jgi:hypothetical protein
VVAKARAILPQLAALRILSPRGLDRAVNFDAGGSGAVVWVDILLITRQGMDRVDHAFAIYSATPATSAIASDSDQEWTETGATHRPTSEVKKAMLHT